MNFFKDTIAHIKTWPGKCADLIKKLKISKKETIWGRYQRWIIPIVTMLVVVLNWLIYNNVKTNARERVDQNAREIVELQAKNLGNIFQSHKNTTQKLFSGFKRSNIDKYMKIADEFVKSHPYEYDGYLRLTFRDGKSYTSNNGLDPRDFSGFSIPIAIFNNHVPFVITSPYNHVDGVNVEHYGIHHPLIIGDSIIAVITTTIPKNAIDMPVSQMLLEGKGTPGIIQDERTNVIFQGNENGIPVDTTAFVPAGIGGLRDVMIECNSGSKDGICTINYFELNNEKGNQLMTFYCAYVPGTNWGVNLAISSDDINHDTNILMVILISLSLASIVILYLVLKLITKSVVLTPIEQANRFAKDFSEGKLYSTEINNIKVVNEFGEMRNNMSIMKDKVAEVVDKIRMAANNVNSRNESLIKSVKEISEGAQLQSVNTEEISASIENIIMAVRQITDNANDASTISDEVANNITKIAQFSKHTLETIKNVIGKIAIINNITQSTDMLAINASVEAARAGEFGKGFHQVAQEIRKLAEVCKSASAEINSLSAESMKITEVAVNLIAGIEPKVTGNAEMVKEISKSCAEQISLANSMALPIQNLVNITSSNSLNADELSVHVNTLSQNCQKLVDSVRFFKTEEYYNTEDIIAHMEECSNEIIRLNSLINSGQKTE